MSFYRRVFLNTEEFGGSAHIEAKVGEIDVEGRPSFEAEFRVSDCDRIVTLQFNVYDDAEADHARQKIRKLRQAIVAFEAALLGAIKESGR